MYYQDGSFTIFNSNIIIKILIICLSTAAGDKGEDSQIFSGISTENVSRCSRMGEELRCGP